MCTQTYLRFACCPCQLRYRFEPCAHGPADPRCRGPRAAFVRAGRDFCHHHRWLLQRSAAWHAQQIRLRVLSLSSEASSSSSWSSSAGNYHHHHHHDGGGVGGGCSGDPFYSGGGSPAPTAGLASGAGGEGDVVRVFGLDMHTNQQPAAPRPATCFQKRY